VDWDLLFLSSLCRGGDRGELQHRLLVIALKNKDCVPFEADPFHRFEWRVPRADLVTVNWW
jgi:hypothetical protein